MSFVFKNHIGTVSSGGGGSQPAVVESLSITPTTEAQTITAPEGVDGYSPISVGGVATEIEYSDFTCNDKMKIVDGAIYPDTSGGNSYIKTDYNISFTPTQWQKELIIQMHIKTPSTLANQWIMSNGSDWNNGIGFTTNSELNYAFWACLGQSNRSYVTLNGTTVPQTETEYWIRIYKPNTENEAHDTLLQISTDGVHWNTEASQSIANIVSDYTTTGNIRLFNLTGSNTFWQGGIYLDGDTFISIDGEKVWYLMQPTLAKTTKYGASINNFLGDVNSSGVIQAPTDCSLVFSGVKKIPNSYFSYGFVNTPVESVSFPDLETIEQNYNYNIFNFAFWNNVKLKEAHFDKIEQINSNDSFMSCFSGATNLETVTFNSVKTIEGALGSSMFYRTKISSNPFPNLETISAMRVFASVFSTCPQITTFSFNKLSSCDSNEAFRWCFGGTNITSLSFPALKSTSFGSYTNQFKDMLSGVTGCTVHFPSNLQSVIGSWSDVTNGFGGTNTTVLFDLTATE